MSQLKCYKDDVTLKKTSHFKLSMMSENVLIGSKKKVGFMVFQNQLKCFCGTLFTFLIIIEIILNPGGRARLDQGQES